MKRTVISITVVLVVVFAVSIWYSVTTYQPASSGSSDTSTSTATSSPQPVSSFSACAKQYSVMESYPRRCQTPSGDMFVEDVSSRITPNDLMYVTAPGSNETVRSPLAVEGAVDEDLLTAGNDLSIRIVERDRVEEDERGFDRISVTAKASPQPDWQDRYTFRATTTFDTSTTTEAMIVFDGSERPDQEGDREILQMPVTLDRTMPAPPERSEEIPEDAPPEMREAIEEQRQQR